MAADHAQRRGDWHLTMLQANAARAHEPGRNRESAGNFLQGEDGREGRSRRRVRRDGSLGVLCVVDPIR